MSPDAERPGHIEAASVGARGLLGFYGSTPAYRSVLEIEGRGDLQPELNALSKTGDIMTMIDLVDDDLLRTLAVVGTPEECAAEIRRRFGDVADRVCAYFPGTQHPTGTIRALAEALRSSWPALFPGFHRTGSTGTARGGHRAQ
ncbi:LLM class flavin-dependent oxidoreductase [uncultured Nocardioides sp.]|uniref:LLM class flavin-dependent oxidoreductase n=1 Tax=uncultured Nocardioides sp. TaxID=198441 RepID=UPI0026039EBC|nr:LLM class flavin-dependent oxidoreductase [uncultured Nocardioides sp.]